MAIGKTVAAARVILCRRVRKMAMLRVRVRVRRAMLCHELEDAILTMAILTMAILTMAILTMAHHDFEDA
eukprot:scaffold23822_cov31-Phaeocystis_antarctica.AAC.2